MLVLSTVLASACAGTLDPAPKPAAPRPSESVASTNGYSCGDTVANDQLTTGGKPVAWATPCWDTGEEKIAHDEYMSDLAEARAAADDRSVDAQATSDERTACHGLSERELEHTPFSHRREIAEVIPHRQADNVRGVRIIWKPVPGLSASWMRQAISCHRARFARLGEPAIYFPDDPTLVSHAMVSVEEHAGHLEVLVETSNDTDGQIALDRAQNLLRPNHGKPKLGVKAALR
ncbi:MAG TPA: hypothetical protein VGC42_27715 [Kofleriaceae bacterium]